MIRFKGFIGATVGGLEKEINEWLIEQVPTIKFIGQSQSDKRGMKGVFPSTRITITIWYEPAR